MNCQSTLQEQELDWCVCVPAVWWEHERWYSRRCIFCIWCLCAAVHVTSLMNQSVVCVHTTGFLLLSLMSPDWCNSHTPNASVHFSVHVFLCLFVSAAVCPLWNPLFTPVWELLCLAVGGYCLSARVWLLYGVYVQCVCVCPALTFSVQFTRFVLAVHSAQRFFPTGTLVHLPLCVCDVFFCVCW